MQRTLCKVETLPSVADCERRALKELDVVLELARDVDVPVVRKIAQWLQQTSESARVVLSLL